MKMHCRADEERIAKPADGVPGAVSIVKCLVKRPLLLRTALMARDVENRSDLCRDTFRSIRRKALFPSRLLSRGSGIEHLERFLDGRNLPANLLALAHLFR